MSRNWQYWGICPSKCIVWVCNTTTLVLDSIDSICVFWDRNHQNSSDFWKNKTQIFAGTFATLVQKIKGFAFFQIWLWETYFVAFWNQISSVDWDISGNSLRRWIGHIEVAIWIDICSMYIYILIYIYIDTCFSKSMCQNIWISQLSSTMVATQKEAFRFAFINLVRPTDDSSPAPDARLDDMGDSNRQTSRLGHVHPLKGWSFRRSQWRSQLDLPSEVTIISDMKICFVTWTDQQIFKMEVPTWICWEGIGCHLGGLKITKKPRQL